MSCAAVVGRSSNSLTGGFDESPRQRNERIKRISPRTSPEGRGLIRVVWAQTRFHRHVAAVYCEHLYRFFVTLAYPYRLLAAFGQ